MKIKWFEESKRARWFHIAFYALLFLSFLMDTFIYKHAGLFFEKLHFFFPLYGFLSCLVIFGITKGVMKFLKRGSDYYEQ